MSLRRGSDNLRARDLKAIVLRRLGRDEAASTLLRETLALGSARSIGPDICVATPWRAEARIVSTSPSISRRAGLYGEASKALEGAVAEPLSGAAPLIHYYMAHFARQHGRRRRPRASTASRRAPRAPTTAFRRDSKRSPFCRAPSPPIRPIRRRPTTSAIFSMTVSATTRPSPAGELRPRLTRRFRSCGAISASAPSTCARIRSRRRTATSGRLQPRPATRECSTNAISCGSALAAFLPIGWLSCASIEASSISATISPSSSARS